MRKERATSTIKKKGGGGGWVHNLFYKDSFCSFASLVNITEVETLSFKDFNPEVMEDLEYQNELT